MSDDSADRGPTRSVQPPRLVSAASHLAGSATRVGRIARWELTKSAGTIDRKTILLVLAVVAVAGVVGLSVADEGLGLEDEIYVVGVDEDDPYHDVASESEQFRPIALSMVDDDGGDVNADVILTRDGEIYVAGEHGEAAYDAFRDAIDDYNEQRMADEADEAAAYPVLVTVNYQERTLADVADGAATPDGGAADASSDDGAGAETPGQDADSDDGIDTGGDGVTGEQDAVASDGDSSEPLQVPDVGDGAVTEQTTPTSPGALEPPFPFEALVLAFLFIVPMNFVIQAYGSTIMDERIKRRGELLLVSPASSPEIVAGKTLPYLLGLAAVTVVIARAIGGGGQSIAAAVPIALAFLAATFVGAMFARSFKELTFVTVTISVVLTTYTFVPAIFTDVTPIALISPLTLIVMDLQNESAQIGEFLFSTGPFYLGAAVCFLVGIGVYREEDMFSQKPIPAKIVDAITSQIDTISSRVHAYASPFVLSMLAIPFVFAAQLLAVALLFVVPEAIALPVMFVLAAAIEEFAKSVHVYAGYARSRFDASLRVAAVLGVFSGAGFFLAEKFTHAVQLVGLPDLTVGAAAFGPALSSEPLVFLAIFFAPLVLHVVTAVVGSLGASRGRHAYAVAFVIATLVHALYNLGVIALVA
ncbi:PrsW family intramembrane metalloprotease [Salinadaptatus halalkaliphilus]|uniref:PrsW family intramembrane metalloprotease n=1 Tax=Salinadaptatus halalkaliphilus TaxID=2419781 RepID=UPI001FE7C4F1|nr:PrsW family intramembrane metalloprotease [Salinadaptatus halalkaliphilus]